MSTHFFRRYSAKGFGLEHYLKALREPEPQAHKIRVPPSDLNELRENGDSYTLESFTNDDAQELGFLLLARLLPLAKTNPCLIQISHANSSQVMFQMASGSGTGPENESWVARKRRLALRYCGSSWYYSCYFGQNEEKFAARSYMSREEASQYAIHGGAVPIRVRGVEGIVAVVVVSGLQQEHDHGVIMDVIEDNWEKVQEGASSSS